MTREIDPVGRTRTYTYAANDIDLLEARQVNGQSTDLLWSATYNSQHQPLTVTTASGQTWTYTYNAQGQVTSVTTPQRTGITENRTATYTYDSNGYLQSITGPAAGSVTTYTYDGYGRIRTVTDSDGYAVTYDYDALDRVTKATYPDGTFDETAYNRLDPERQRDRLGDWTHTFYDALRRPVATRDPVGRTITQQWCNCGSLDKVIDGEGRATTWERDLQGRVTREVRPDSSSTNFIYENTASRLKQRTDSKNQTASYEYFLDDNLKQITYTNALIPTANVSFNYDPTYNRLLTRTDGVGSTNYLYNPITVPPAIGAGQLASIDGPLANDTIAYSYDEQGRATGRSINGVALTQSFDALGRIAGETNALGSFSYAFAGTTRRPTSATYPNGQTTTFDYLDNLGDRRLKEIHNKLSGGATLSKFNYTREATGRLKTAAQQLDASAAKTYEYGFDLADQLTSASLKDASAAVLKSYGYGYDKAGNRTVESIDSSTVAASFDNVNRLSSQQVGGALRFAGSLTEPANVTVGGTPAQVTADNRFQGSAPVTSGTNTVAVTATDPSGNARTNTYQVNVTGAGTSFTYDGNGNLTSDGSRTFEWDAENRLTAVNQGTRRSEFTYDGTDLWVRMVEKDGAAVLSDRRYVWCGLKVCEERDASGATVTKRFFDQGIQEGADNFFYTGDQVGSIREMTDAAGTIRARYDYDPYGRRTKLSGDKDATLGFTGHFFHAPSGLTLAPYRAYDASLGRWISEDPTGLGVGDPNRYRYVWNSPTGYVDPTGEFAIAIPVLAAFGLVLTTAVAIYYIQHGPPPLPIPVNPLPPVPPSQPVTNPVTQPPAPPAGGPPAAPAPPAAPPAPMPMAPPTPMPPPVPPVPVPTKPTIQVPSGPKPCPPQKPSGNMCVQAALCLAQAKGFAKLRCMPLIIACIAQTAGGGAGGGGKP